MKKSVLFTVLALALVCFCFSVSSFGEEKAKDDKGAKKTEKVEEPEYSPKVKNWLAVELTFESKGYAFDTVMAICCKLSGAYLRFEEGMSKMEMPKIYYSASRYTLETILNDVTKGTKFTWTSKGDKIIIIPRKF